MPFTQAEQNRISDSVVARYRDKYAAYFEQRARILRRQRILLFAVFVGIVLCAVARAATHAIWGI